MEKKCPKCREKYNTNWNKKCQWCRVIRQGNNTTKEIKKSKEKKSINALDIDKKSGIYRFSVWSAKNRWSLLLLGFLFLPAGIGAPFLVVSIFGFFNYTPED